MCKSGFWFGLDQGDKRPASTHTMCSIHM